MERWQGPGPGPHRRRERTRMFWQQSRAAEICIVRTLTVKKSRRQSANKPPAMVHPHFSRKTNAALTSDSTFRRGHDSAEGLQ